MNAKEYRNIISDAMDNLAMACVNKGDVDVADHVDTLLAKIEAKSKEEAEKRYNKGLKYFTLDTNRIEKFEVSDKTIIEIERGELRKVLRIASGKEER